MYFGKFSKIWIHFLKVKNPKSREFFQFGFFWSEKLWFYITLVEEGRNLLVPKIWAKLWDSFEDWPAVGNLDPFVAKDWAGIWSGFQQELQDVAPNPNTFHAAIN